MTMSDLIIIYKKYSPCRVVLTRFWKAFLSPSVTSCFAKIIRQRCTFFIPISFFFVADKCNLISCFLCLLKSPMVD